MKALGSLAKTQKASWLSAMDESEALAKDMNYLLEYVNDRAVWHEKEGKSLKVGFTALVNISDVENKILENQLNLVTGWFSPKFAFKHE